MKLASFTYHDKESWGLVVEDAQSRPAIVDLCAIAPTLRDAIAQGALDSIVPDSAAEPILLDAVSMLPPVPSPEKIICIGVNYVNRNSEYKDGSNAPEFPSVFMRTPDSLTGHGLPLVRPPESHQLDYEGEIVVIIGKPGRRIPLEKAYEHIAGLSIMNEGTLRDWVRHAKFNVTQGKNFVHSGACGPWMVTADQFTDSDYENMLVQTRVNGEIRQDDTTANMAFPIAFIIHYLSTFFQLKPGDVIATGTPTGAGARFDPPKYLKPGDVVEVEVGGIGVLKNGIVDEAVKV